jgi:hypothetical protein
LATFALLTVTGLDAQTPELSPCQQFLKKVEACVPHAPPELREVLQQSLQEMRATFTRIDKAQKQLLEQGKDLAKDVPNLLSEGHDAAEKMCAQLIKDTFSGSDCGALKPPM